MSGVIVAITGASGAALGVRLLEELHRHSVDTHLVVSKWGWVNIKHEMGLGPDAVKRWATETYTDSNMGATISSGSFVSRYISSMVVVPCSMKTLAAIAHDYEENLVVRAASVVLKERKLLVVAPRETPLHAIQLKNLLELAQMGVVVFPPMPSFYHRHQTMDDMINQFVGRLLGLLGVESDLARAWRGLAEEAQGNTAARTEK